MNQTINILIVEDERIPAEFLKSFLEYQGYKVIGICDRGEDAIQMAQQFKPDVIFMDIMLKDKTSGSE
nr:response regulator [Campylobacterota bacterium]